MKSLAYTLLVLLSALSVVQATTEKKDAPKDEVAYEAAAVEEIPAAPTKEAKE